MEEFKPKRKNNTQPVQAGQNTGRAPQQRRPRAPKPQGENAAAPAQHKPRTRKPRPAAPAAAEQSAVQSIPAPRPLSLIHI